MTTDISSDSPLVSLLRKSHPSALPEAASYSTADLIKTPIFSSTSYTDADKAEINQWLITASHIATDSEDAAKTDDRLSSLNTHLASRTTLLGSKPSIADIAIYSRLAPVVATWSADQRTGEKGYHHIVRHLDFVQNAHDIFGLKLAEADLVSINPDDVKVPIPPVDPKAEKEKRKKEKEASLAAGTQGSDATLPARPAKENAARTKKDKTSDPAAAASQEQKKKDKAEQKAKQKQGKPAAAAADKPLSPALIDLRVGHILKAEKHPNADSLYVSTIAVGDASGTDNTSEYEGHVVRTVCSGLNGLIPLEDMQQRKIVAVCNLKPVTMRGVKSCAMVLAASPRVPEGGDAHAGPVELVSPPAGAAAGERVFFEGWEGAPEGLLNPKKKVWEECQVGFTTTESLGVAFDRAAVEKLQGAEYGAAGLALLRTAAGLCSVQTLKGATVR